MKRIQERKQASVFNVFTNGFYQINVAILRPTEFNFDRNLHTGKFCAQCRIKFQLQCSFNIGLQNRHCVFAFFRRAEASTRRARSASHARREGREKKHRLWKYERTMLNQNSCYIQNFENYQSNKGKSPLLPSVALLLSWIIIIFPQ